MNELTTDQMAETFGTSLPIAACTKVTETLELRNGKWEMTRTFTFADGTLVAPAEASPFYVTMPALPGWNELVLDMKGGEASADDVTRLPVAAWRYDTDPQGDSLRPVRAGDGFDRATASAIESPDGRVVQLYVYWRSLGDSDQPHVFLSADEWVNWVKQQWAEYQRKEAAERKKHAPCAHCGRSDYYDSEVPF